MDKKTALRAAAIVAEVAEQYNQIAPHFAETRKNLQWDGVFTDLLAHIPQKAHLLDVGCGSGRLYRILQKNNRHDVHYEGLDSSAELIKIAQKDYPNASFAVGSMTTLPYPKKNFDCIAAIASLHHIPEALQADVMQAFYRILKKGGLCAVTVWNLKSEHQKEFAIPWKKGVKTERYYYGFSQEELKNLMEKAGFHKVTCTEIDSNFVSYGQK